MNAREAMQDHSAGPAHPSVSVTVAIPTFRRPELLRRAIGSVLPQGGAVPGAEILVVDNCPDASARAMVEDIARAAIVPVRYVHEPRSGVSRARNAALDAAAGTFVAFLDDDEIADPDWLGRLLAAQSEFQADVVLGPTRAVLPATQDDAAAIAARQMLTCEFDAPSGSLVGSTVITPFWARRGKIFPRLGCGNVLLHRASPRVAGARFDDRFGRTGGEDTVFLTELALGGARIVWCADAIVTEPVLPERLNIRTMARRAFRGGQGHSWVPMTLARRMPLLTLLSMGIGAAQVVVFAPVALLLWLLRSPAYARFLNRTLMGLGKVLWMPPFRRNAYG